MSITRVFRKRAGVIAEGLTNEPTALVDNPLLRGDSSLSIKLDAEKLFTERYPIIRKALEAHKKQGVLILAFDRGRVALGTAWLAASLDKTRAAIIGRHSMCSLALSAEHGRVSLRHLAVLVRAVSHTDVRIRVIDLHTQTGFSDEASRVLQAVTSEGSMFLRVGDVDLAFIVTHEDAEPTGDAAAAYKCLPPRVFIEERPGTAGVPVARPMSLPMRSPMPQSSSSTYVRSQVGAFAAAGSLCADDEAPYGTLIVRAGGGSVRRPVGASVLERGILVGRYSRCDVGVSAGEDSRLSRVHLLLVKDGDEVFAIDTASINGTYVDSKAILLKKVEDGVVLDLGGELELVWHADA